RRATSLQRKIVRQTEDQFVERCLAGVENAADSFDAHALDVSQPPGDVEHEPIRGFVRNPEGVKRLLSCQVGPGPGCGGGHRQSQENQCRKAEKAGAAAILSVSLEASLEVLNNPFGRLAIVDLAPRGGSVLIETETVLECFTQDAKAAVFVLGSPVRDR